MHDYISIAKAEKKVNKLCRYPLELCTLWGLYYRALQTTRHGTPSLGKQSSVSLIILKPNLGGKLPSAYLPKGWI